MASGRRLVWLALAWVAGGRCEYVEVPIDAIRSPKQLAELLPEPPPQQEAPAGLSWARYGGAINVSCEILFPLEGSSVLPQFEVMVQVLAEPLGALQEQYREAFHCLEVDGGTPACWPLLDLDRLPRFAGLTAGVHRMRAAVTDAHGTTIDARTWSPERTFLVATDPLPTAAEANTDADAVADESAAAASADDETVVVDAPRVRVSLPLEMSLLTTSFFDLAYQVLVAEPPVFERLFNVSHACGALDGQSVHACWPIFGVDYKPRWMAVPDGLHTIEMVITHPNSAEEIPETWSPPRAFLVLSDDGGAVRDGSGGWSGHADPDVALLDIQVGATNHPLPVRRGSDYDQIARLFCASRLVANGDCATAVVREIQLKFQAKSSPLPPQHRQQHQHQPPPPPPPPPPELSVAAGFDIPDLSSAAVAEAMAATIDMCLQEQRTGGVGLDCLTAQSALFGMRTQLGSASEQEALMAFVGNLGAAFDF